MLHTITITREDFLNNDYSSTTSCPCAQVLKRTFPDKKIRVYGYGFWIDGGKIDFDSCLNLSHPRMMLEDVIVENADDNPNPEEVKFSFFKVFPKR